MRANLTTRDYEMLSAYIDGQLAPGEQRKLEERLHARPELQVALDEMRRTRALLRQAPRRKAPRNFTLTPAMVGEQRRRPAPWAGWFPALSFTSAVAALALVFLVVMQFAPGGATSQTVAMQPPAADMRESAPQEAPSMKMMADTPAPEVGAAQPKAAEGARAMDSAAPTATAAPAVLPAYEATAQAFGEVTPSAEEPGAAEATAPPEVAMAAPKAAGDQAATAPPVIQWNNAGQGVPYAGGAGGMGGGGGGGEGPSLGPLMGPPPAPSNEGATGLGGGAPDGSLALPPEAMQKSEITPAAPETPEAEPLFTATPQATTPVEGQAATPVAELPAAPEGAGPILGVPGAGEGGQIVEKKAIMGESDPMRNAVKEERGDAQPGAGEVQPLIGEQPQRGPLGLTPWALTAIQVVLGLLAVATGVAAYLMRLRRSR